MKVIQLVTASDGDTIALCDDGSIWRAEDVSQYLADWHECSPPCRARGPRSTPRAFLDSLIGRDVTPLMTAQAWTMVVLAALIVWLAFVIRASVLR